MKNKFYLKEFQHFDGEDNVISIPHTSRAFRRKAWSASLNASAGIGPIRIKNFRLKSRKSNKNTDALCMP